MSDLTGMIEEEDESATPPPPEGTTRPAAPEPPEAPPEAPAEAPPPAESDGAEVPAKREPKRLPRGLVKGPSAAPDGEKSKPKGKTEKPAKELPHDKARRFARVMGKMLNRALDAAAEQHGSPIRASISDPKDESNGLVTTIEFPDAKPAGGLARPKGDGEELLEAFGDLLVDRTPGEALAYHAARCVPSIAALDEELRKRPWLTLCLVTGATVLQFGLRVVATIPEAPKRDNASEDPSIGVEPR